MKKILLLSCILSIPALLLAQWQPQNSAATDVGNIYHLNGNVGIGTNAPTSPLQINGAVPELNLLVYNTSANGARTFLSAFPGKGAIQTDKDFAIMTNGGGWTNKLLVTNAGNVGIGTSSPRGKLDVDGAGDIYLSDEPSTGTSQSLYIPGHVFMSPYDGGNVSYFQARRPDNSGTTSLQFRTTNSGSLVEAMTIAGNGNVGVGNITPLERLSVTGNLRIQGVSGQTHSEVNFYRADGAKFATIGQGNLSAANSTFDIAHYNGNDIRFMQSGVEAMRILANGSVGIGSVTTGTMKLAVEGKIGAREVNVTTATPWPDYVFEKNYNLPSLTELENYIDQNKHLPDVPTAKEVKENGVNLGEMNALLLKKVEELTLYVIELKKEIETLKKN